MGRKSECEVGHRVGSNDRSGPIIYLVNERVIRDDGFSLTSPNNAARSLSPAHTTVTHIATPSIASEGTSSQMCGIAGWIGPMSNSLDLICALVQSLRHRGPDAQDYKLWPDASLVHTRLSILDRSSSGAQPMANEDGSIWTVFNGEIYNHAELRQDLITKGHKFRGRSDTEILPHLYEEEGAGFVHRLRGMFAFAIFDTKAKKLLLVRDRFGIKPLFYSPEKGFLAFASEINALRLIPGIDLRPDPQAIYDFAALFYIPAPETFFKGIKALEPGCLLEARCEEGRVRWKTRSYHKWTVAPNPELSLEQAVERADELIHLAVDRQMESDVPLGSLLSGGIDSSLVSAAAQRMCSEGLRTFNVQFPDRDYDETWAARAVAKHIKSQHETLSIQDAAGTWESVTSLLRHAGQPFADTSLFALDSICKQMRRYVTVALSGDGGDEAFGGYDIFWRAGWIARSQVLPPIFWDGAAAMLQVPARLGAVPSRLLGRFPEFSDADDPAIVQGLSCWIRGEEHRRFCRSNDLLPVRRHFERQWECYLPRKASRTERLSALATEVNFRLTLPGDFLFKVDTASMRESLEVRVPMLDEDLVEFGLTLPHTLKVNGWIGKRVLRGVAARRLPKKVASKKKWGFGIPVDRWVNTEFLGKLRETVMGRSSLLPEFFDPGAYSPWIEAFCAGQQHPNVSRAGLYQRAILLLAVDQALASRD